MIKYNTDRETERKRTVKEGRKGFLKYNAALGLSSPRSSESLLQCSVENILYAMACLCATFFVYRPNFFGDSSSVFWCDGNLPLC
jgi:hypothetical protein